MLAALQLISGLASDFDGQFAVTEFREENELLQGIVLAGLAEQSTIDLVSRVLLAVADFFENRGQSSASNPASFYAGSAG